MIRDELTIKVNTAIERCRQYVPTKGFDLADSYGKDSGAVRKILELSEVAFDAHHNLTTIDPPELQRFGRTYHPDTEVIFPRHDPKTGKLLSFYNLVIKKGFPPTRVTRYCCSELKERGGKDRIVCTGRRREESANRANAQVIEPYRKDKRTTFFNPIFDWTEQDVWQFHIRYDIPYCILYKQGFSRLGCIMCPLSGSKHQEFEATRYPAHYAAILRTFDRMIKAKPIVAEHFGFKNALDVMQWYIYGQHIDERTIQAQLLDIEEVPA